MRTLLFLAFVLISATSASAQHPVSLIERMIVAIKKDAELVCPKTPDPTICRLDYGQVVALAGTAQVETGILTLAIIAKDEPAYEQSKGKITKTLSLVRERIKELSQKYGQ